MTPSVPKVYDHGDMITLSAVFYKKDGTLGDPTAVVLKIRNPLGVQSSQTPTRDSLGSYSFDFATTFSDPAGKYEYRFEGTGAITTAEEKSFVLRPTEFS